MSANRSNPNLSPAQLALTIAAAREARNQAAWQLLAGAARRLIARLAGSGKALHDATPLTPHSHA